MFFVAVAVHMLTRVSIVIITLFHACIQFSRPERILFARVSERKTRLWHPHNSAAFTRTVVVMNSKI